jgi:16S rRNA (cytosine967-C5)-methyltransferase
MSTSGRYDGGASPIPGLAAREAALRLLDAVLRQGQTLDSVVSGATRKLATHEDRGLALAIASEVLRWLPDLDALIDSATAQALPEDAKARMILRIALVQVLIMRTPPHAAIATALPLVMGGPKRLVHGVFGTLMRRSAALPALPTLPAAVAARWSDWGEVALADAAQALAVPPPLDLVLRDVGDNAGLGGESLTPGHHRVPRGTAIVDLPGYAEGKWWVQNLAASIPARLLGDGDGRTVLDLCAAPGGKTMQLAAQGWAVTAVDSHAQRLDRLRENLARTQLVADIVHADILSWEPLEPVDAILLDAPCTATGTFARHPDVLHRIGAPDIAKLSALQARMLKRAMCWLKPGGHLVFATCSMEREEGEDLINACGFVVDRIAPNALPDGIVPTEQGWLRILPKPGLDGFFIARLKQG